MPHQPQGNSLFVGEYYITPSFGEEPTELKGLYQAITNTKYKNEIVQSVVGENRIIINN